MSDWITAIALNVGFAAWIAAIMVFIGVGLGPALFVAGMALLLWGLCAVSVINKRQNNG